MAWSQARWELHLDCLSDVRW